MAGNWLEGRTVLVTGAARRLGRATALALADAGASVVVHHGSSGAEAEELRRELTESGAKAWALRADLADSDACESLLARAAEVAGRVDALVNNASVFPAGDLQSTSVGDLEKALRVNAWAPLALARALARDAPDGRVVNVLDTRVVGHDGSRVAYWLSKRALQDVTELLAVELAPRVTVNAVAPGLILPPEGEDEAYLRGLAEGVPLARHGGAEDVTRAILFLLDSGFVTGETVFVDGGQHLERGRYGGT